MRKFFRSQAAREEIAEVIVRCETRAADLPFNEATINDENFDYAYSWGVSHGLKAALMILNGSTAREAIEAMRDALDSGVEPE